MLKYDKRNKNLNWKKKFSSQLPNFKGQKKDLPHRFKCKISNDKFKRKINSHHCLNLKKIPTKKVVIKPAASYNHHNK